MRKFWLRSLPAAAGLVFLTALTLQAQYFGQNKVRYKTLDFKVLHTEHFDIYYYPEEQGAAVQVGRMAERWRKRLGTIMQWELSSRQPVVLYASSPDFRSTTVIPGDLGPGIGGVTEPLRRRVVLPLSGPMAETDHVLGHELVHAFQYDISSRGSRRGGAGLGMTNMERLPLWFIEGMAEYLSLGPDDPNTSMWMRDAVRKEKLPTIKDLDKPKYFPYRWGQALWAYIGGRWGDETIGRIMKAGAATGNYETAIQGVVRVSTKDLSPQWQNALRSRYESVLSVTVPATQQARMLVSQPHEENGLNVSPALSPDGKYLMFLSQRELISIDVFMADAVTGKVIRKITKTALDAHMDVLDFVNSVGAWSRDSQQFAFSAISNGRPELDIYDVSKNHVTRRLSLPKLDEVLALTWSPRGQNIAISAMAGGVTDLYILSLGTGRLRQVTNDAFCDLQPDWSPDGSRIAFVTDRFKSDETVLAFGQYRLALLDPESGSVEPVAGFDQGKHINPQWSGDSKNLYFVSDRDGIDNLYRVSLQRGNISQITNLQTGVTGITALSPAISYAESAGRLVFSAYENGNYDIFRIDSKTELAGKPPSEDVADLRPGLLPPRTAPEGLVVSLLRDPANGLVPATGFKSTKYQAKLGLEDIAPPTVVAGMSNYGSFIGGGAGLYFADMLEFHQLMIAAQTDTTTQLSGSFLNNLAAIVGYENQRTRWNWGFSGGQVPYLSGGFGQALTNVRGQPALVNQEIDFWQIERQFIGNVQYPFNRAQRIEFSGGYERIDFDAQSRIQAFSLLDGSLLLDRGQHIPTPKSLNMGTGNAALVYDTSVFGGTSPIMGQRYRLEVGGLGGSLNFATLLADYRKYYRVAKPLILAGRFMHYGRYGGDANDPNLQDLFLGYPELIRGYEPGSFSANECGPGATVNDPCPVFDKLIGSRIAVVNAELRTPLLGLFGIIPSRSFPPIENAIFYDAGVAWNSGQKAYFLGGPREPARSYGDSIRLNVFGYAIAQVSYVHALDRPRHWMWEFSLIPGF